ncbi:hypothetical protein [Corallococcus macrosporus]|uniref:Uncharacterized protein n=1 Tax=Myxococcus fulvus (strain ATCC BAA-855 / HW-1) TaxID=483219 RepID=F8CED6_MYXFH|nr:hypothetical protein [Corallococcus macrosporus]AEI64806.1 hypothetical protein LILAB_14505 [Corallococcus macrosporus]
MRTLGGNGALRIFLAPQASHRVWSYSLTDHGLAPETGAIDSLDTLAELLARHGGLLTDLPWTELPTFGGPPPPDTTDVWSWDARRLLVGTRPDLLRLVPRDSPAVPRRNLPSP